jgi:hypothetical protein
LIDLAVPGRADPVLVAEGRSALAAGLKGGKGVPETVAEGRSGERGPHRTVPRADIHAIKN